MRSRLRVERIAVFCLLAALLAGCDDKGSSGAAAAPSAPEVVVAPVIEGTVPVVMRLSGTVESVRTVEIIPRVSGYLEKRYFE
jgi:multidrug efflux pump subunit AcrA (membrane-fusion protein)